MIYLGSRETLKAQFKAEILKEIDDRKPFSIKDMEFVFVGNDGKKYYHFFDPLQLPLERFARKKTLYSLMALGMDVDQFDALIDTAESAVHVGLKNGKAAADVIWVLKEMKRRRTMTVQMDLIMRFIAVHYVAEDESPDIYDIDKETEKITVFLNEIESKGCSFFLTRPEFNSLSKMYTWSQEEWTVFWHESKAETEALKIMLDEIKERHQKDH